MILLFILSALLVPIIAHGASTALWGEITTPDTLDELDPEKCDAYFEEIGWCQSEIGQHATPSTRANTNTSPFEIPDYCFHLAQSLGQIYELCAWDKNALPTSVAQLAATDLPPEASDLHLSKRGARCPRAYHFLLADKDNYHYFFCCPNANDKLLLPQDYTQPPRCCYKGKSPKCDVDAQSIPEVCLPEQEITDYGSIKGCRYRIRGKDKRNGPPITSLGPDSDFHPTTVQLVRDDHPSFYCGLRGCQDGLYEVWIGDACRCVRGPKPKPTPPSLTQVTVHSSVTGFISDIAGRNAKTPDPIPVHSGPHWGPPLQESGTTTQIVSITAKPTTLVTVTNGAAVPDIMTKGGTLTIGGVPFQADRGICGFCSYDFAAGNGLPYGVMVDDAKAFCSANEARCPTHSKTTPQTHLIERDIPLSMTADAMVTIANIPFVAPGGVCGFCQYGDSVDFQPGYGIPYRVGQEDARKFCSRTKTISFRCPHPTPTPPPMKRADADGTPKNEILTISKMQFVWFGGLCDFCKTQEAYNFEPGHGLPYGVMPDDAMRYCKTMAMTC